MSADHLLAVVPARDEQDAIARCVRSILQSADVAGLGPGHFQLVVVADSCRDGTARAARQALCGRGLVLEVAAGSAGRARAIGTDVGLRRWHSIPARRVWTVHTDADSVVPEHWLERHRQLAGSGLAAVAGVVEVDSFVGHHPGVAALHAAAYASSGDEHPHVHGANLGVRADVYLAVGGWATVSSGEDNSMWDAVRAAGYPTRATRTLRVMTSGRVIARAPRGFATYLHELGLAAVDAAV